MAVGNDLRHMYTVAVVIVCGVACTKVVGHLNGVQGATAPCFELAFAVLMCSATAIAGHLSGNAAGKIPAAPRARAGSSCKAKAFPDAPSGGEERAHTSGVSEGSPAQDAGAWWSAWSEKMTQCFSCCMVRGDGAAGVRDPPPVVPVQVAPPLVKCSSVDSLTLGSATEELRSRLADLLGPPGSLGDKAADEVAVTSVQRYGGERSCMSRFLRVKKYDVDAAEEAFRATVEFRRRTGANDILEDPSARKVCDAVRPYFAAAPVMFTAQGNIVIFLKMAEFLHIWRRGISEEDLRIFYVSWMEQMLALQAKGRAQASHGPDGEMPACIEVYDLDGIGLRDLRCLSGLRMMTRILGIGQSHYPENLHTAVIVNIPSFASGALQIVQSALDARTQEKLRFAFGSGRSALDEILNVDLEELAKRFRAAPGSKL